MNSLRHWHAARVRAHRKEEELRQIVRTSFRQIHFLDNRNFYLREPVRPACVGDPRQWVMAERPEEHERRMFDALNGYCEPIPALEEFARGIAHFHHEEEYRGQRWDVARALGSKTAHYRSRLQNELWPSGFRRFHGEGAPFNEAYPNIVFGDGWSALTPEAFDEQKYVAQIHDDDVYVEHLLNRHDGEVRHWGPRLWREVPAGSVAALTGPQFWHYQFAKTGAARRWLTQFADDHPGESLTWSEIAWVLQEEGGETTLLKCDSASGESGPACCSQLGTRQWFIRAGHHVTLAEMFDYGCRLCSCHFLYTLYLRQPIFLAKRNPPESPSRDWIKLQKAREQHFFHRESAGRGLPWHPPRC